MVYVVLCCHHQDCQNKKGTIRPVLHYTKHTTNSHVFGTTTTTISFVSFGRNGSFDKVEGLSAFVISANRTNKQHLLYAKYILYTRRICER